MHKKASNRGFQIIKRNFTTKNHNLKVNIQKIKNPSQT